MRAHSSALYKIGGSNRLYHCVARWALLKPNRGVMPSLPWLLLPKMRLDYADDTVTTDSALSMATNDCSTKAPFTQLQIVKDDQQFMWAFKRTYWSFEWLMSKWTFSPPPTFAMLACLVMRYPMLLLTSGALTTLVSIITSYHHLERVDVAKVSARETTLFRWQCHHILTLHGYV